MCLILKNPCTSYCPPKKSKGKNPKCAKKNIRLNKIAQPFLPLAKKNAPSLYTMRRSAGLRSLSPFGEAVQVTRVVTFETRFFFPFSFNFAVYNIAIIDMYIISFLTCILHILLRSLFFCHFSRNPKAEKDQPDWVRTR